MFLANYREIQAYVESKHGFVPCIGWIAGVKELCHIPYQRERPNLAKKEIKSK
jgi:hypothetical protein